MTTVQSHAEQAEVMRAELVPNGYVVDERTGKSWAQLAREYAAQAADALDRAVAEGVHVGSLGAEIRSRLAVHAALQEIIEILRPPAPTPDEPRAGSEHGQAQPVVEP